MSTPSRFDVFLCHNSEDKPAVIQIAEQLKAQEISPWLDIWELRPGLPWQIVLEEQMEQIHSAAVFVGSKGLGPWQRQEIDAFLREFVDRQCPVIPVLLPNAPEEPKLPLFLRGNTWVDFRHSQPDPMTQLIWGITGKKPKPKQESEAGCQQRHNQAVVTDDLSSEKGVDYTKLRDLLKAGQWKEADRETVDVMLKASRTSEGLLDGTYESLACTDLRTIDQLWVKYSKHRFGLSVQKKIWQEVNEDYRAFGDRVGWRGGGEWYRYSELTFSLEAPMGHLPKVIETGFWLEVVYVMFSSRLGTLSRAYGYLFSRVENCKL